MTADLITRLERADWPDRELFREVYRTIFPTPDSGRTPDDGVGWARMPAKNPDYIRWAACFQKFDVMLDAGAWTDAALTLVPVSERPWSAWNWAIYHMKDAATPAIALCIAALRAQPETGDDQ